MKEPTNLLKIQSPEVFMAIVPLVVYLSAGISPTKNHVHNQWCALEDNFPFKKTFAVQPFVILGV